MRLASLGLLLGTLALAACDNDLNLVFEPITGTFVLQSVGGDTLPIVIRESANPSLRVELLSDAITIGPNGTFSTIASLRQTLNGTVSTLTVRCNGTYSFTGVTINFVEIPSENCGDTFSGTQSRNTLTTNSDGVISIWSR